MSVIRSICQMFFVSFRVLNVHINENSSGIPPGKTFLRNVNLKTKYNKVYIKY